jgi:hypothetical protein
MYMLKSLEENIFETRMLFYTFYDRSKSIMVRISRVDLLYFFYFFIQWGSESFDSILTVIILIQQIYLVY